MREGGREGGRETFALLWLKLLDISRFACRGGKHFLAISMMPRGKGFLVGKESVFKEFCGRRKDDLE